MARSLPALLLVAVPLALAGCIDGAQAPVDAQNALGTLLPATEALWANPQTTPHPLFGFPTVTHPATGAGVPEWWMPIDAAELPASITGIAPLAQAADIGSGAGMTVFGRLAIVPGFFGPSHILDISDPSSPQLLSTIDENHRNVDVIAYPTGRLVAVFSTGSGVLPVYDITDPRSPELISTMEPTTGTHKVNVVPGTPIVYNANSNGGGSQLEEEGTGVTEIFDLTDPENPVHVQDFANGFGCHHIYFWNSPSEEKYRALCAGIEFTQIWDIADPRAPEVIVSVPVHHGVSGTPSLTGPSLTGLFAFSHFSILNDDGTILIVGDEMGGGSVPPGCGAYANVAVRDVSTPLGALWFYDVSDETNPRLLGWFSPGHHLDPARAQTSCTAHHGRLVPDPEGRDLLAMAFYGAGVGLIDFSDPASPRLLDQFADGTDTWEVQYYNGYLFTGDLARGMDVLTFE
jgi:hypothetical protein